MKLTSLVTTVFFVALSSATLEPLRRTTESSPEGSILFGGLGHIYLSRWIPEDGSGFDVQIEKEVPGLASWMVFVSPDRLYVADLSSNILRLYDLDLEGKTITFEQEKKASDPLLHLEINKNKTRLFATTVGDGAIDVWNIEGGGLDLMKTIPCRSKDDEGACQPRQANLDPTGRFLAVNDYGTDSLIIIDTEEDRYEVKDKFNITSCGPNRGVFYPRGADKATSYILVCGKSNDVLIYSVRYEGDRLKLDLTQRESTFGDDSLPANETTAAAVAVALTTDNHNLYVSNRSTGNATDYISFFRINTLNQTLPWLSFSGTFSSHGFVPWTVSPSRDGKWLFIANGLGGDAGAFAMKVMTDGKLKDEPEISISSNKFGGANKGPWFVQQIE
ncbi:hypothetical protein FALBO_5125 [Fusarium albosuccineum]|uniref:Uncharacterized protein n=1 Tax=Fusarium albosuccineum TaxID=1237068 RepID=A0A8H4LGM7_9HYPO|nr:hypothetical protein FALBO_5125 [Fusarium albosuccineum]KAF5000913.1 hypothetical protein FDECE_11117 [Fusarium decemcellulare]